MCKFHLMDGRTFDEQEIPGGWKDFPFKQFVNSVTLFDRLITPHNLGLFLHELAGFAIHWVGQIQLNSGKAKDVFREVMMVEKTGRVFVSSLNCITSEWADYEDDLKNPIRPHLMNYNLETHGIKL
jgi:hypothetical protein